MKVIKKGKWTKKVVCNHCHTELLIEEEDVKSSDVGHDFYAITDVCFTCPVCGGDVPLSKDAIPPLVRDRILKKILRPGRQKHARNQKE